MANERLTDARAMTHLIMSYISTRAIYVAAKIALADQIGDAGATSQELAKALNVHADALYRIMRLLAGLGILRQAASDRFFLTPLGETLRTDCPASVRDYAIYSHEFVYPELANIMHTVRTGEPVIAPHFEYLHAKPELESIFHAAMSSRGRIDTAAIIGAYDFSHCGTVVDVGGGNGAFLSGVLAANAQVFGILFDQESGITAAKAGRGGPLPRCRFAAGSFFDSVPPDGDTYILKRVLDDWNDDDVLRILANCRTAMKPGVRLLIIDPLIGAPNERTPGHLYDMTFLVLMTGRVRTADEYSSLLGQSGFRLQRIVLTESDVSILEAFAV
ncbi:MAG: methyltransferase [Xanthobacteraceae bacterium]